MKPCTFLSSEMSSKCPSFRPGLCGILLGLGLSLLNFARARAIPGEARVRAIPGEARARAIPGEG